MQSKCWINKLLLFSIFMFNISILLAQLPADTTSKKKKLVSFEKSIFVGTDFNNHALIGFSGPQLMFSINDNTKVGACYYPSLWWNYKTGEVDTKLGVGARMDYKHSIIGFNTINIGNNKWIGTLILGLRF